MIPVVAAGSVGLRILKTLYKGKAKIGKGSKTLAAKAGKAGFARTSQVITGTSQKVHKGTRWAGKTIKKHPKKSAAFAGAVGWDLIDRD